MSSITTPRHHTSITYKPRTLPKDTRAGAARSGPISTKKDLDKEWVESFCVIKGSDLFILPSEESEAITDVIELNSAQYNEWYDEDTDKGLTCVLLVIGVGPQFFKCPKRDMMNEWKEAFVSLMTVPINEGVITPPEKIAAVIRQMQAGESLLKYGRKGEPHFRSFKLSADGRQLTWQSKRKGNGVVEMKDVSALEIGQKSANFQRKSLHLEKASISFSLKTPDGSLDLICRDKLDFTAWTTGLRFLMTAARTHGSSFHLSLGVVPAFELASSQESGISADSDMLVWGRGEKGQIGCGDYKDSLEPRIPEGLKDISQIAFGKDHAIAISKDTEQVFSWGCGANGRLGLDNNNNRNTPKLVTHKSFQTVRFKVVAAGDFHSLAVTDKGDVYSWGMGYFGQLGHGDRDDKKVPAIVEQIGDEHIVDVACSSTASFAISRDHSVYYWGLLDTYCIEDCCLVPKLLDTSTRFSHISAGDFHAAAIADDGSLHTWGDGSMGQLGHSDTKTLKEPTKIETALGVDRVDDVACGATHTAAISGGRLFIWGLLLRNSKQVVQQVPLREDIPDCQEDAIVSVSCAAMMTAITTESGRAFMWGVCGHSILGCEEKSDSPTQLQMFCQKKVKSLVLGGNHIAAFVAREWLADDQAKFCMACKTEFSTFVRRHHCRKCGKIYCGPCSSKTYPLVEFGHAKTVRVCDSCYSFLSINRK